MAQRAQPMVMSAARAATVAAATRRFTSFAETVQAPPPFRNGLSFESLKRVRSLWQEDVPRLTLSQLQAMNDEGDYGGDGGEALQAARQVHQEIKVRIAHRIGDFLFLPYKVMANPSVRLIYEKYVSAYNLHEDLAEVDSMETANRYWVALSQIMEANRNVTRLLGHGRRQVVELDPEIATTYDAFLTRFFTSRIGTHLLGAHFLEHWPPALYSQKPVGVETGVLQPINVADIVEDLVQSLEQLNGRRRPIVEVESAPDITSILGVPGHIRVVLREVLQNACAATIRTSEERHCDPKPVHVKVNRGQFGVFVTISDRGGGIESLDDVWRWGKDGIANEIQDVSLDEVARENQGVEETSSDEPWWSGADDEVQLEDVDRPKALQRLMLPLGFGLPVARITARYFGGDVRLLSLVGCGTSAYIHIPEMQRHGSTTGSSNHYGSSLCDPSL